MKNPIPLIKAEHVANAVIGKIKPLCETDKCVVAGSLRRREKQVGDIEIVCIPRWDEVRVPGEIFSQDANLLIHYLKKHGSNFKIVKGGPRYYQVLYSGAQFDIFMVAPKQWGRMLALRTGPAEYSIKLASRWKELGYVGRNGELISLDGRRHKPAFPDEQSFFDFLGWNYVEPERRGKNGC